MKIGGVISTAVMCLLVGILFPLSGLAQSSITTVAVVQLRTTDTGSFSKMQSFAEQAKAQGADLIIFPEGSVFGWLNPAVFISASPIPGKYSDQFAAIAKSANIWVAAGLAEQGPKAGPGSQEGAHQAYDSGILINPQGVIVLHHRKFNVLKNAFDPEACKKILNQDQCSYTPGELSDISIANTPFGKTSLLVCSDAFTYPPAQVLEVLKPMKPDFVIVPWGITAASISQCGTDGFNATGYAAQAAAYLNSAFVVGANAVGTREYGKYLPSVYCGTSGYANPTGQSSEAMQPTAELIVFKISNTFDAQAGPIWDNTDAQSKCPLVCPNYSSKWNGQWRTTVPGQMSVCGCSK